MNKKRMEEVPKVKKKSIIVIIIILLIAIGIIVVVCLGLNQNKYSTSSAVIQPTIAPTATPTVEPTAVPTETPTPTVAPTASTTRVDYVDFSYINITANSDGTYTYSEDLLTALLNIPQYSNLTDAQIKAVLDELAPMLLNGGAELNYRILKSYTEQELHDLFIDSVDETPAPTVTPTQKPVEQTPAPTVQPTQNPVETPAPDPVEQQQPSGIGDEEVVEPGTPVFEDGSSWGVHTGQICDWSNN